MAQAVVLEWVLPDRAGAVAAGLAGPPGPTGATGLASIDHAAGDLLQDVGGTWTGRSLTEVLASGASVGGQVTTPVGLPGTSGYGFEGSSSSFYASGVNTLGLAVAGGERVRVDGVLLASAGPVGLGASAAAPDVVLNRDGADALALRRGASPQVLRSYNSYTDGSNYERANISWEGNTLFIGTQAAGTGAIRDIVIRRNTTSYMGFGVSSALWNITAGGHLLTASDGVYDIGASGANRPRNGYFGGALSVGLGAGLGGDLSLATTSKLNWNSDLFLVRDAANLLAQRNGTSAQTFRLYQTYTDAANGAWLDVGWNATNAGWTIGAGKNGSGSYGYLYINIGGTPRWYFGAGSNEFGPNADNICDIGTAGGRVRTAYVYKLSSGTSAGNIDLTGTSVKLDVGAATNNPDNYQFVSRSWSGSMSATGRWIGSQVTIAPSSGGASQQSHLSLRPTINQTGTHTGDIVVYHADVTLTAAQGATFFAQYSLGGAAKFSVTTAGRVTAAEGVVTTPATFAGLPVSPANGQRAFITDSNLAASGNFGAAAAGGGSNHVPVYYDGGAAAWKIG